MAEVTMELEKVNAGISIALRHVTDAVQRDFLEFVITVPNMQQSFLLDVDNAVRLGNEVIRKAYEFGARNSGDKDDPSTCNVVPMG